jgi:signal transduction histidine kinase
MRRLGYPGEINLSYILRREPEGQSRRNYALVLQSEIAGLKNRLLFVKVFLWFWVTALVLFGIFLGSRMIGMRVVPPTEVSAAFAPAMANEAAQAYESGGPQAFAQFERTLKGTTRRVFYLIDGFGNDVLSRSIPTDSQSMVKSSRSDGRIVTRYGLHSQSAAYRFTSSSGHPYIVLLHQPIEFLSFLQTTGSEILFVGAVLLIVTLLSLWLAHHIAGPIHGIQSAARSVAKGDLKVRAPVRISKRHDELAALAMDFDSMVERIGSLVHSQKNLLNTVSHELRSPLARLNMSLALLRRQSSQESEELIERMEHDVERIDGLMDQLLTLSRLEAGISSSGRENVNLTQLIQEIVADGNFEAQGSGKSVRLEASEDFYIGNADQAALRSACENIIRNAIRHTRTGTAVDVLLRKDQSSLLPQVSLFIRDRGPGVPEEFLAEIFQPFFRVKPTPGECSHQKGNGLGLAIAYEAIRLHKGSIVASNLSPSGLEIEMRIPNSSS